MTLSRFLTSLSLGFFISKIWTLQEIGDTKGNFQAKMGTIKDRNTKVLTEADGNKKRQQEYTELY